jgi:predicted porin
MNKKLMAVAIAGALAVPGIAFAQASSVTISGMFKVGVENLSYSNQAQSSGTNVRLNSSQNRVVDNSSRIIFTAVEDLGGGLAAVGNLDVRFAPDQATNMTNTAGATPNPIGSGNTYVGLRGKSWGQLTFGRWDLHYGKGPSEQTRGAGALVSSDVSVFDYIQTSPASGGVASAAANVPIAATSRTQNVVRYDTPNWGGFTGTIAWSANPGNAVGGEADMSATNGAGVNTRKGSGWNFSPKYTNGPFQVEYSFWRAKPDAPVATTNDQRGDSLNAKFQFGGFQVGVGWNKSKLENSTTQIKVAERTAWALAGNYKWGPHAVFAHYTKAGNISTGVPGAGACPSTSCTDGTGARMMSAVYEYSFSKRTSVAATLARINNDANANYNFFTSSSLGSSDATVLLGESPRIFQMTILHLF